MYTMNKRLLMRSVVAMAGGMLLLWGPARAGAVEARLSDDTYTDSSKPTINNGTKATLNVQSIPTSTVVWRSYVRFDLSPLPAGTTASQVLKATLRLFVDKVTTAGSVNLRRVLPPTSGPAWTESTLTAGNAATSAPLGSTIATVAIAASGLDDFFDVDVTTLVMDWVDGTLANN